MKFISKRKEPRRLRAWKRATKNFPDASYDTHQFPKEEVKASLVEEQGELCAYTMIRIESSTSHIEHLKPRTVSRDEGKLHETTHYGNLVACFPNTGLAETEACPFGADFRKSNWDPGLFITPLNGSCETRFRFNTHGEVHIDPEDAAAEWTKDTLNLNEASLVELRRAEVLRHGLSPNSDNPVTAVEARQIAEGAGTLKRGRFKPFCVAIRHAAIEYAERVEKSRQKRRYAAQSRARKNR